ncbi:MAG: hypothetical protein HQ552_02630 [Desulfobacteraceae bacterium]|nr:hypothetical protein [Desulfobacteraceae bacterium]
MNRKIKLQLICGVIIAVLMCFGCVTTKGAGPKQAIPPESPFTKIKTGMGTTQVQDLLGIFNDFKVKAMPQGYIPFYRILGGNAVQSIQYYKGQGRIYFEGDGISSSVVKIEYDPTEDGYQ